MYFSSNVNLIVRDWLEKHGFETEPVNPIYDLANWTVLNEKWSLLLATIQILSPCISIFAAIGFGNYSEIIGKISFDNQRRDFFKGNFGRNVPLLPSVLVSNLWTMLIIAHSEHLVGIPEK